MSNLEGSANVKSCVKQPPRGKSASPSLRKCPPFKETSTSRSFAFFPHDTREHKSCEQIVYVERSDALNLFARNFRPYSLFQVSVSLLSVQLCLHSFCQCLYASLRSMVDPTTDCAPNAGVRFLRRCEHSPHPFLLISLPRILLGWYLI